MAFLFQILFLLDYLLGLLLLLYTSTYYIIQYCPEVHEIGSYDRERATFLMFAFIILPSHQIRKQWLEI